MSGADFVKVLESIGYPKAGSLSGKNFDWMFENEATLPFLHWFCSEIGPSNVLTTTPGAHELGEAPYDNEDDVDFTIVHERRLFQDHLALCEKRRKSLIQQRNMLSAHYKCLWKRLAQLESLESKASNAMKVSMGQIQGGNTQMNTALSELTSRVKQLTSFYHEPTDASRPVFLSQVNLDSYHQHEALFTKQLTAFTKKLFFEGVSQLAAQKDVSRYTFLDITDPDLLVVRGEKEKSILCDCKELARIHATYPKVERRYLNAKMEERSALAASQFLQSYQDTGPRSTTELRTQLEVAEQQLERVKSELHSVAEGQITALIDESSSLQMSKILCGDYNLKIARQDYFTANQDQVLSQLITQRARYELLSMAYEVEAKCHQEVHHLLVATATMLTQSHTALSTRLELLKEAALTGQKLNRKTVDSSNSFLHQLNSLLMSDVDSGLDLYIAYSSLQLKAEELKNKMSALRSSQQAADISHKENTHKLEQHVADLESLVYADSSTQGGQPELTPKPILDVMDELTNSLNTLGNVVVKATRDIEMEKQKIMIDPLLNEERQLFIYFHTDHDRLRSTVEDLEKRMRALATS